MRLTSVLILPIVLLVLGGCGGGEDVITGAQNDPNDFTSGKNPADNFSPGSTGDSSNTAGLEANEVRITMEVPGGVAPGAELTRRNLRIVQPDRVSVYTTNTALQNLGSVPVSTRTDDNGFTVIAFDNGLPLGPDVLIDASYGNVRLRALAADADRDVKINPFSEYLVRNTLPGYTPGQFQSILDCVEDANGELCLNKYVWSTLADQVHDFEIDIPSTASLNSALDLLSDRGDFARYVSAMADYALLDETSSGKISASSADYNSVFFGVELGQTYLESSLVNSGQWGARTAQEERLEDQNGVGYVYPALTLTSFDAFNIRVTSLASDIPYAREALIHQAGNDFFLRGSEQWDLNTHASSPGAATLVADTRILAGRALYQSITGRGSSRIIGWSRNPYYLDAYTSEPVSETAGPDRVVSGYFSAGKAIELEASGEELRRKQTLENHYLSVLELDLLREPGFRLDTLDGRTYNVLYLATLFSDAATPVTFETGLGTWQISGTTINQNQLVTIVTRDSSGTVTTDDSGSRVESWTLSNRTSRLSDGDANIGRLNLDVSTASGDFEQPDLGIGASTPDGSLLAFNLDDSGFGDGILIAAEQASTAAPTGGSYRLQGIRLGMTDDTNHLAHLDNAELTITDPNTAILTPRTLDMVHTVSDETATPPELHQGDAISLTYDTSAGDGQVKFIGPDSILTLEGFFTEDQDQFYLRLRDTVAGEEQIGLVTATRIP